MVQAGKDAMKILITGANGMIGQHLARRLLKDGHEVTAFIWKSSSLEALKGLQGLDFAYGDVRELDSLKEAINGKDVVFHLAGVVHLPYKEEQTYFDVNVTGTENVLKACAENASLKKLVHCSSASCYAPNEDTISESFPCNSKYPYGKSKLEAEIKITDFAKKHPLPYVIVRPARVYGPGDMTLLPLFRMVKNGTYFHVGKMDSNMMPIHTDDMAEAFVRCIGAKDGEVYNAAGPEVITTRQFMEAVAKIENKKLPSISVPVSLVKLAAIITENIFGLMRKDPPLSLKKLKFFTVSEKYSTKKIEAELGFVPTIKIEKGLEELYKWYIDNKHL